jgi:hypothetical protein
MLLRRLRARRARGAVRAEAESMIIAWTLQAVFDICILLILLAVAYKGPR